MIILSDEYKNSVFCDDQLIGSIAVNYHVLATKRPTPGAHRPHSIDYVMYGEDIYAIAYNPDGECESCHLWCSVGSLQAQLNIQLAWRGYNFFSGDPLRSIVDHEFFRNFKNV